MEIRISRRAEKDLDHLKEYLLEKWSERVKNDVFSGIKSKVNLLIQNPELGISSKKKKGIRKCVVSKQTSFFYKIEKDIIIIITFHDNRKDPKKLKL